MAGRITQLPIEVIVTTDRAARVTQLPVETIVTPDTQKARVTQVVVEVIISSKQTRKMAWFM